MPTSNIVPGNVNAFQLADALQYIFAHWCFDWYVQVQVQGWFITLMTVVSAHTTRS